MSGLLRLLRVPDPSQEVDEVQVRLGQVEAVIGIRGRVGNQLFLQGQRPTVALFGLRKPTGGLQQIGEVVMAVSQ